MKKTIIAFLCIITMVANAGELLRSRGTKMTLTFDISPKIGYGNAIFLNGNVDSDPYANRYFFSPAYFYGGRTGVTFMASSPRYIMFTVYGEYLFNSIAQNYQLKDYSAGTDALYKHGYTMSGNDLAFIFRTTIFTGEDRSNSAYFEVGHQTTTLRTFSETNSITAGDLNTGMTGYSPASRFNSTLNNVVFGVGAHGSMYSLGLRCTYGLNSLMAANHNPVEDGHYSNVAVNTDYSKYYSAYKETHLLLVQLVLEINLYVLEVGNATCGKKRLFPFPFHLNNIVVW